MSPGQWRSLTHRTQDASRYFPVLGTATLSTDLGKPGQHVYSTLFESQGLEAEISMNHSKCSAEK